MSPLTSCKQAKLRSLVVLSTLAVASVSAAYAQSLSGPVVQKQFLTNPATLNSTIQLQFTISNPNSVVVAASTNNLKSASVVIKATTDPGELTNIGFTDTFPSGLDLANTQFTSNCGGSVVLSTTGVNVTVSGVDLDAGASCTITVNVTPTELPSLYNQTSTPTSDQGPGTPGSDNLIVIGPPVLNKAFGAKTIQLNGTTSLSFNLFNPNDFDLTGVGFTDTLPAGLVIADPADLNNGCGGSVTANAGSSTITVSGIDLAGSCDISLNVTGTTPGLKNNVTSAPTSNEAGPGQPATASITVEGQASDPFLVSYAANLPAGDSNINFINTGENGASLYGPGYGKPSGNLCVNIYALDPGEELVACCSCLITPDALESVSVNHDFIANPANGVKPSSIVIKIVTTLAGTGGSSTSCTNSAGVAGSASVASGLVAWRTTLHAAPSGGYATTEVPFIPATLSAAELASLENRCTQIIGNGTGAGICASCRTGGLGAARSTE